MSRHDIVIVSVDPGAAGAAVVREFGSGKILLIERYDSRRSVARVVDFIDGKPALALVEKVSASGLMMPANAFSFGGNYEGWIHAFIGARVGCYTVTPQRWQRAIVPYIDSREQQRKRDLRDAAIALFDPPIGESLLPPKTRITLDNCDALLLSEYARRQRLANPDAPLGDVVL